MEGPSLVILREELAAFTGQKVMGVTGNSTLPIRSLKGQKLKEVQSWGKHLLLIFNKAAIRIHFLMWGSYRIDEKKKGVPVRLGLRFAKGQVFFYSCSIRFLEEDWRESYDWSKDTMSASWDSNEALRQLSKHENSEVCDVLMNQNIFSGVGNIIKNEVLFNLRVHPESRVGALSSSMRRQLVREVLAYCRRFYEWKKAFELKKHWRIYRKRECPRCHVRAIKRKTGDGQRWSFFCESCQVLYLNRPRSVGRTSRASARRSARRLL